MAKRYQITKRCYFENALRMEGTFITRPDEWPGHKYARYMGDVGGGGQLVAGDPPEGYDPETGTVIPGYDPLRDGSVAEQLGKKPEVKDVKSRKGRAADAKDE